MWKWLKGGFSKLVQWLSGLWSNKGSIIDEYSNQLSSFLNSQTGAHLTGSQIEANQLNLQNYEELYQHQVTGMQNAGLNPALMYQSGTSQNVPTVQGNVGALNMSDLMQMLLLDKQGALLDAQAGNLRSQTDKNAAETENMKLINQYYPTVTITQVQKMLSEIGVNDELVQKYMSEVDLNELELSLKELDKIIKEAEANEASAFFKARRELEEAQTESARADAAEKYMRAAMEEIEKNYMASHGTKMSSSQWIAVASALAKLFSVDVSPGAGKRILKKGEDAVDTWVDSYGKPGGLMQSLLEKYFKKYFSERDI